MKPNLHLLPALSVATVCCLAAVSCGRESRNSHDRLPEEVKPVAIAIMADSPSSFASAVTYPLERPYPLKDVKDSVEMVEYYDVLVDDSLKNTVKEAPDTLWSQYGWRGWTLGDGSWIWIDDGKIYAVNYLSGKEKAMLDSLRKKEISSLEPSLQGSWTPVLCVVDTIGGNIFRIDSDSLTDANTYRLAGYKAGTNLNGKPSLVLYGTLDLQGSMGNRFYHFADSVGNNAEYSPDLIEEDSVPEIEVTHQGNPQRYKVVPTYWLDHIRLLNESMTDSTSSARN